MNGIIRWFIHNGVAANLLMVVIIIAGLATIPILKREVFPEIPPDKISVSVPFLGATPEEVEEGICVKIEEAVSGLTGIERIRSTAREGTGSVVIEVEDGVDVRHVLDEVKARVDTINTFPEDAEKPVVQEAVVRMQVIDVAIHGDVDVRTLRKIAERTRDDIVAIDDISVVEIANVPAYEISIGVSETNLRRYGLTFDEVANAIRSTSLDRPGGSIDTRKGQILVRAKGQRYRGEEFEDITLRSFPDGTRIRIADVAEVRDGFAETDQETRFDEGNGILVSVFRVGDQNALEVSRKVKEYVEEARSQLPEGVLMTTWQDDASVLRSRLDLLLRNGRSGLILVLVSLALFLRLRLAFWVSLGIPISFLGAIILMPPMDISISVISLFAFIIVLGIVVDDAIIVGENIFTHTLKTPDTPLAAERGAREVAIPVVFAVLTTMAAFSPLLSVPGRMGQILRVVPCVVIATLVFSVIESLFILPRHLSHVPKEKPLEERFIISRLWARFQGRINAGLQFVIHRLYRPSLEFCVRWRYATVAASLAVLLLTIGWVGGGRLKFLFLPEVDADSIVAYVTMPEGTAVEVTREASLRLERAAIQVREELEREHGEDVFRHIRTLVGGQPYRQAQGMRRGRQETFSGAHLGEVTIELAASEERPISSTEIARRWREATGSIPDATEISFSSSLFSTGEPVNMELNAANSETLSRAVAKLKGELATIAGVQDITDSLRPGKREIRFAVREDAEHLGVTHGLLARQVRQAFYGEEAQRIQRGRDEVKVMVRYPEAERESIGSIEELRIRTPKGSELPFLSVATIAQGRSYSEIKRADRRRVINVTAGVDSDVANANEVNELLRDSILPKVTAEFPDLQYSFEGEQREQGETMAGLAKGFLLALVLIYVLLAIPFRSYAQPLIVMSSIPFGIVGAVWGHVLMGMNLTLLSSFGIVALTGVIVNDSLVMVDFINRARDRYLAENPGDRSGLLHFVRESGIARFRPILLTSLTTFVGLTPLLLEQSMQARFLIPLAISLGFGVLFATVITLVLVPVGYAVLHDLGRMFR